MRGIQEESISKHPFLGVPCLVLEGICRFTGLTDWTTPLSCIVKLRIVWCLSGQLAVVLAFDVLGRIGFSTALAALRGISRLYRKCMKMHIACYISEFSWTNFINILNFYSFIGESIISGLKKTIQSISAHCLRILDVESWE